MSVSAEIFEAHFRPQAMAAQKRAKKEGPKKRKKRKAPTAFRLTVQ
jgi:hypothetical protein